MGTYADIGQEADDKIETLTRRAVNAESARSKTLLELAAARTQIATITAKFNQIEELIEKLKQQAQTAVWEYNELKKENDRLKGITPEEPEDGPEYYA